VHRRLDDTGDIAPEAVLRATALVPMPFAPALSVRVDARAVMMPTPSSLETVFQLGVGFDIERPIDRRRSPLLALADEFGIRWGDKAREALGLEEKS
jgi:hypothetical protein